MLFNDIAWGNPSIEQKILMEKKTIVDDLFPKLTKAAMPANDSEATKAEMNQIVVGLKEIDSDKNQNSFRRYINYDKGFAQYLHTMLLAQGVDDQELIYEIMEDISPLITKIKFKYNRPRPSQLAHYVKLNLFPLKSTSALSPSYPSGHTTQAYVIMSVIGNRNPGIYAFCKQIIDDIAESRVAIGVHYSSDNDFAFEVGEAILKHKKFAEKYGI
jgi:hypothetical protein